MELQDFPFNKQPIFMSHKLVLRYLQEYRKTIYDVRFRSDKEVIRVYYSKDSSTDAAGVWHLTTRDVSTGLQVEKVFAAVVSAVGVFEKPFMPPYEGLEEFEKRWPDSVSHAKSYRGVKPFRGKVSLASRLGIFSRRIDDGIDSHQKVLIVGFGASGFDIARQVSPHAAKLWVSSVRDISDQVPSGTEVMPDIEHFDRKNRVVVFENDKKIWHVDHVIFCTGFSFSQPFIKHNRHSNVPFFPDGPTIRDLHEHMVFKDNPTLAFVGMIRGGAPTFLLVQAQAAFLSRLWSGRLPLDIATAVKIPASDDAKSDHVVSVPRWLDYVLRLEQACVLADEGEKLDDNLPVRWTSELDWAFQNRRLIREVFFKRAEQDQQSLIRLSQLGFDDQNLSPSSQNMNLVLPFLILHAAYFKNRQLDLVNKCFPSGNFGLSYPGLDLFDQVNKIFDTTQRQLNPASRKLFKLGAKRLMRIGLQRMKRITADLDERNADPQTSAGGNDVTSTPDESDKSLDPSLLDQEKRMRAIYSKFFSVKY